MRLTVVRIWSWLAAALLAAALGDMSTEFAENLGWLGGTLRDAQHEAVLPTLVAGLTAIAALLFAVMFARIAPVEPVATRWMRERECAAGFISTLCGSLLITIVMEGYETRFGGVSPFDARSVVLCHAPALLLTVAAVVAAVRLALHTTLRLASSAGDAMAEALAQFLHRTVCASAPIAAAHTSGFALRVLRLPEAFAGSGSGLRAPPLLRFSPPRSR